MSSHAHNRSSITTYPSIIPVVVKIKSSPYSTVTNIISELKKVHARKNAYILIDRIRFINNP